MCLLVKKYLIYIITIVITVPTNGCREKYIRNKIE